jgi:hypothetical protein
MWGCTFLNSAISSGFHEFSAMRRRRISLQRTASGQRSHGDGRRKSRPFFIENEPVEIIDLGSGSGGAMPQIIEDLLKWDYDVRANLTDLYPNPKSGSGPRIKWMFEPVDANLGTCPRS